MKYYLKCLECGATYESDYRSQVCRKCLGILEVIYPKKPSASSKRLESFWDLEGILPDGKYNRYEVGLTRLVRDREMSNAYLKLETENPSHSFKDRGSVIEVGKAYEYGFGSIVCASTGNMAYSVAYYAKLYGIKAKIFISDNASIDKVRDIRDTHDADITRVNGDFNKAQKLAERYSAKHNAFLAGDYCYRKEGQKTIAYEILLSMRNVNSIIVPVGNATLLTGMFKAIEELKADRRISEAPRIIGVEAEKCSPLHKAFISNKPVRYEKPRTKADAIAVGYPTYGDQALEYMRRLGGSVETVTESDMLSSQKSFIGTYGMNVELAGVAAQAYMHRLRGIHKGINAAVVTGANV